jgi:hypothetical protein
MVLLEAAVVIGIFCVIVGGAIRLLTRPPEHQRPALAAGQWRAVHYDVKGDTHVVLQKVSASGANVLDEHVVATIPVDDPEYEARFLAAMSAARERRALFDTEEE